MPNPEKKSSRMPNADAEIAALHKEWDDVRCPICMDHPHNAVLLLCSSHGKGCRSYVCDTSYRHSNCLDRFRKMNVNHTESSSQPSSSMPGGTSSQNVVQRSRVGPNRGRSRLIDVPEFREDLSQQHGIHSSAAIAGQQDGSSYNQDPDLTLEALHGEGSGPVESAEASNSSQLMCPLCRGAVKGWEIIKDVRQYLDAKPRACSREACVFSGTYGALRKHARRVHPTTRPADVDPSRRRAWHCLEHQREYGDILSAIRSAMPGAVVFGDYAIEGGDILPHDDREGSGPSEPTGSLLTTFLLFHMMSTSPARSGDEPRGSSRGLRRQRRRYLWGENLLGLQYDDDKDGEEDNLDEEVRRPRGRRRFERSRSEERR